MVILFSQQTTNQMAAFGYNAAMHAASILGQPERALELFDEMKVCRFGWREGTIPTFPHPSCISS